MLTETFTYFRNRNAFLTRLFQLNVSKDNMLYTQKHVNVVQIQTSLWSVVTSTKQAHVFKCKDIERRQCVLESHTGEKQKHWASGLTNTVSNRRLCVAVDAISKGALRNNCKLNFIR